MLEMRIVCERMKFFVYDGVERWTNDLICSGKMKKTIVFFPDQTKFPKDFILFEESSFPYRTKSFWMKL